MREIALGLGRSAGGLARPDSVGVADAGGPEIEQEGEAHARDPQETAHGYDCPMPSPKDVDRIKTEMEELFADLCQARLGLHRAGFRPRVDVFRTDQPAELHIVVELAGIDPADVELAVVEGVLVLSGRRRRASEEREARRYHHMEIDYGSFERRIAFGENVDAGAARADYEGGLLTVVLPLAERAAGPVRVKVTSEGQE
jgi:HSP20 family protein